MLMHSSPADYLSGVANKISRWFMNFPKERIRRGIELLKFFIYFFLFLFFLFKEF